MVARLAGGDSNLAVGRDGDDLRRHIREMDRCMTNVWEAEEYRIPIQVDIPSILTSILEYTTGDMDLDINFG
jgi:hypothetical protein